METLTVCTASPVVNKKNLLVLLKQISFDFHRIKSFWQKNLHSLYNNSLSASKLNTLASFYFDFDVFFKSSLNFVTCYGLPVDIKL